MSTNAFVYVNTGKQVGDAEHIKVFASEGTAERWFKANDPEGLRSNMKESRSQPSSPTILRKPGG